MNAKKNLHILNFIFLGPHRVQELMKNLSQSRYFQITLDEVEKIKSSVNLASGWCNENECKETMIEVWNNDKYMLDPHTSVAVKVAKSFQRDDR